MWTKELITWAARGRHVGGEFITFLPFSNEKLVGNKVKAKRWRFISAVFDLFTSPISFSGQSYLVDLLWTGISVQSQQKNALPLESLWMMHYRWYPILGTVCPTCVRCPFMFFIYV